MKAFTLLELVVVLLLIMLLTALVLPSWLSVNDFSSATREMMQLRRAINYTRSMAIYQNKTARLQPLGQWQQGYVVTIGGRVVKQFSVHSRAARIEWSSFPGYNYLAFTSQGFTANQNGTFRYLNKNGQTVEKLVVSQSGRVRIEDYCTGNSAVLLFSH